jgi:hypothetical protein
MGAVVGLVLGAVASAGFAYSNLGPSSRHPTSDNSWAVLVGYAIVAVGFVVFGAVARRRLPSIRACALAGATAGVVIAVVVASAIGIIDNVWLSTVARQPDKIYGLAHSAVFHSMRAYLNGQLLLGLLVIPPVAAIGCATFAGIGARIGEARA